MRFLLIFFGILSLVACGKSTDPRALSVAHAPNMTSNESGTSNKDLFSSWIRQAPHAGGTLDFSGMGFGSTPIKFLLSEAGGECYCILKFSGTQAAGSIIASDCILKTDSAPNDSGCRSANSKANYIKTSDTLTICPIDESVCSTWK